MNSYLMGNMDFKLIALGFALNKMPDIIMKAMDDKKYCTGVFIDFKKGFRYRR